MADEPAAPPAPEAPSAPPTPTPPPAPPAPRGRGYIRPMLVKAFAFFVITLCLIISMAACILAIWDFTNTDVLWRTVATCVVVAAGVGLFAAVNSAFGWKR